MHFPSGILLHKNLPIYSMVNRISFCSRNSMFFFMFLSGKYKKFPLLIVCRIWFHFGPLLRSAGKTKNITRIVTVLQSIMHQWSIDLFPGKNVLRDEEKFPLIYSMSNPFEFYRRFCFNPLVVERADPNEPDYFETIYPSIHSMVKQVAFWSNYFDKQTQNAKNTIFPVTDDATAASGSGFFRRQKSCTQKPFSKEGIYLPALSIAWEINSSLLKSAPCFSCSFSMSLFRLFVRLITWA